MRLGVRVMNCGEFVANCKSKIVPIAGCRPIGCETGVSFDERLGERSDRIREGEQSTGSDRAGLRRRGHAVGRVTMVTMIAPPSPPLPSLNNQFHVVWLTRM